MYILKIYDLGVWYYEIFFYQEEDLQLYLSNYIDNYFRDFVIFSLKLKIAERTSAIFNYGIFASYILQLNHLIHDLVLKHFLQYPSQFENLIFPF